MAKPYRELRGTILNHPDHPYHFTISRDVLNLHNVDYVQDLVRLVKKSHPGCEKCKSGKLFNSIWVPAGIINPLVDSIEPGDIVDRNTVTCISGDGRISLHELPISSKRVSIFSEENQKLSLHFFVLYHPDSIETSKLATNFLTPLGDLSAVPHDFRLREVSWPLFEFKGTTRGSHAVQKLRLQNSWRPFSTSLDFDSPNFNSLVIDNTACLSQITQVELLGTESRYCVSFSSSSPQSAHLFSDYLRLYLNSQNAATFPDRFRGLRMTEILKGSETYSAPNHSCLVFNFANFSYDARARQGFALDALKTFIWGCAFGFDKTYTSHQRKQDAPAWSEFPYCNSRTAVEMAIERAATYGSAPIAVFIQDVHLLFEPFLKASIWENEPHLALDAISEILEEFVVKPVINSYLGRSRNVVKIIWSDGKYPYTFWGRFSESLARADIVDLSDDPNAAPLHGISEDLLKTIVHNCGFFVDPDAAVEYCSSVCNRTASGVYDPVTINLAIEFLRQNRDKEIVNEDVGTHWIKDITKLGNILAESTFPFLCGLSPRDVNSFTENMVDSRATAFVTARRKEIRLADLFRHEEYDPSDWRDRIIFMLKCHGIVIADPAKSTHNSIVFRQSGRYSRRVWGAVSILHLKYAPTFSPSRDASEAALTPEIIASLISDHWGGRRSDELPEYEIQVQTALVKSLQKHLRKNGVMPNHVQSEVYLRDVNRATRRVDVLIKLKRLLMLIELKNIRLDVMRKATLDQLTPSTEKLRCQQHGHESLDSFRRDLANGKFPQNSEKDGYYFADPKWLDYISRASYPQLRQLGMNEFIVGRWSEYTPEGRFVMDQHPVNRFVRSDIIEWQAENYGDACSGGPQNLIGRNKGITDERFTLHTPKNTTEIVSYLAVVLGGVVVYVKKIVCIDFRGTVSPFGVFPWTVPQTPEEINETREYCKERAFHCLM